MILINVNIFIRTEKAFIFLMYISTLWNKTFSWIHAYSSSGGGKSKKKKHTKKQEQSKLKQNVTVYYLVLLSIRNLSEFVLISMNNKLFLFYAFQIWWQINNLFIYHIKTGQKIKKMITEKIISTLWNKNNFSLSHEHPSSGGEKSQRKKKEMYDITRLLFVVVLKFLIRFIWSVLFLPVWLSLVLLNGPFMLWTLRRCMSVKSTQRSCIALRWFALSESS